MKKNVFLIFAIIVITVILGIAIYYTNYYSLEKVKTILAEGDKLPENILIIQTVFDENNEQQGHIDYYIKGNMFYISQNDKTHTYAETISNGNDNYMIEHDTKTIAHTTNSTENNNDKSLWISDDFYNMLNQNAIYKYCGKETVDNAKGIKVSLYQENVNQTNLTYFWINLEDKHIVKKESYVKSSINDVTLKHSTTYKYECDSVKDTDIVKFDKSKYEDYTYNGF